MIYKTFVHTKLPVYGILRVQLGVTYDMNIDTCEPPILLPATTTIEAIKQYWIAKGAEKIFGKKFEDTFNGWELKSIEVNVYQEKE